MSAIRLNFDEVVLKEGGDTLIVALVEPADYPGRFVWESMNAEVASVEQDGHVTAISGGRTFVLVKSGGVTKGCAVTVKTDIKSIAFESDELLLAEDGATDLKVVTEPAEVFATKLIWESSDKEVVVVADGLLRAEGRGKATVKVYSEDNTQVCDSLEVIVAKLISAIKLSFDSTEMFVNKTLQLSAKLTPTDSDYPQLKWYSTDPDVATVDQHGLVTSLKEGQTKIVVEAVTGSAKAECDIVVRERLYNPNGDESVEDLLPGADYDGWTDSEE